MGAVIGKLLLDAHTVHLQFFLPLCEHLVDALHPTIRLAYSKEIVECVVMMQTPTQIEPILDFQKLLSHSG